MYGNPFLISNPTGMEWLIGFVYPAILGLVGALIVWRTLRAYKNLRSKSNPKGKSSNGDA